MKIVLTAAIMIACFFFGNEAFKKQLMRKKYLEAFFNTVVDIAGGLSSSRRSFYDEIKGRGGLLKAFFEYITFIHENKRTIGLEEILISFYEEDQTLCRYISKEEYSILSRTFSATENNNITEIVNAFEETKKYIKDKLDICSSVEVKRGKLIKKVSVLAGLIAVICLI